MKRVQVNVLPNVLVFSYRENLQSGLVYTGPQWLNHAVVVTIVSAFRDWKLSVLDKVTKVTRLKGL